MTLVESELGVDVESKHPTIDRKSIASALAVVVRATSMWPPDTADNTNPQVYGKETYVSSEVARIFNVSDEIGSTVLSKGTMQQDGSFVMPFEALCADIMERCDIPRSDIVLAMFTKAATHEITLTDQNVVLVSPN